ncbi:hypothetical protein KEJ28_05625, partial [Candidatus Bathyarchaeota archaeon]|nr:hypothetical protein [Candidatus Bathyarchaeota archaeon]
MRYIDFVNLSYKPG